MGFFDFLFRKEKSDDIIEVEPEPEPQEEPQQETQDPREDMQEGETIKQYWTRRVNEMDEEDKQRQKADREQQRQSRREQGFRKQPISTPTKGENLTTPVTAEFTEIQPIKQQLTRKQQLQQIKQTAYEKESDRRALEKIKNEDKKAIESGIRAATPIPERVANKVANVKASAKSVAKKVAKVSKPLVKEAKKETRAASKDIQQSFKPLKRQKVRRTKQVKYVPQKQRGSITNHQTLTTKKFSPTSGNKRSPFGRKKSGTITTRTSLRTKKRGFGM